MSVTRTVGGARALPLIERTVLVLRAGTSPIHGATTHLIVDDGAGGWLQHDPTAAAAAAGTTWTAWPDRGEQTAPAGTNSEGKEGRDG